MAITNVESLREFLARDLERVSSGEITPAVANASANLSGKILQSVKMELQYNAMVGGQPNIEFLGNLLTRRIERFPHDANIEAMK